MPQTLRLTEDILSNGNEVALPAAPRMIFVAHGSVAVGGRALKADEAFSGSDSPELPTDFQTGIGSGG